MRPRSSRSRAGSGIAIVGPGRVGQAMGKLLAKAGFPVRFVAARQLAAARRAVRFIGSGRPVTLDALELTSCQVFLLTVSDAALARVAESLAGRPGDRKVWSGKVVLHTCGSLPASMLRPFKRRGSAIGSLHPFQTIPSPAAGVRNLKGCFWALDGDPPALGVANRWVKALRGVAFRVRPGRKTLYHLSAFLVCPTLVTLMDRSARLLRRAGVPARIAPRMLSRFVAETARNFAELGGRRALTGPASRGDWPTIRGHLAALRAYAPDLVPAYQALLRLMLRLAGRPAPRWLEKPLKR